jgi:hypothetical protein
MGSACLSDALEHCKRQLLRTQVLPQPFLAFQIQVQPPHEDFHALTHLSYVSTLGVGLSTYKGAAQACQTLGWNTKVSRQRPAKRTVGVAGAHSSLALATQVSGTGFRVVAGNAAGQRLQKSSTYYSRLSQAPPLA